MPTFALEDLLLILCERGVKHLRDRLEWLAGFAEPLRSGVVIADWALHLRRASDLGVRRSLFLGLRPSLDLFRAPVPSPVLSRMRADRDVVDLRDEVIELLGRDPVGWEFPDRLRRVRFRIRLREPWRDRLKLVWHRAIPPSDLEQWRGVRIADREMPVHAFRRPFDVFGELASAVRALIPSLR